jgi:hypothetical protein
MASRFKVLRFWLYRKPEHLESWPVRMRRTSPDDPTERIEDAHIPLYPTRGIFGIFEEPHGRSESSHGRTPERYGALLAAQCVLRIEEENLGHVWGECVP